jgi:hypothetical protein
MLQETSHPELPGRRELQEIIVLTERLGRSMDDWHAAVDAGNLASQRDRLRSAFRELQEVKAVLDRLERLGDDELRAARDAGDARAKRAAMDFSETVVSMKITVLHFLVACSRRLARPEFLEMDNAA